MGFYWINISLYCYYKYVSIYNLCLFVLITYLFIENVDWFVRRAIVDDLFGKVFLEQPPTLSAVSDRFTLLKGRTAIKYMRHPPDPDESKTRARWFVYKLRGLRTWTTDFIINCNKVLSRNTMVPFTDIRAHTKRITHQRIIIFVWSESCVVFLVCKSIDSAVIQLPNARGL